MATYSLPELPYDYSALEPHISGKIMELHHGKHHNAYVTGANTALDKLAEARSSGDLAAVNLHTRNLTFNLGGHINHSVFWKNMSPDGGGAPEGDVAAAIADQFGSFDAFKAHFSAAAAGVQGSGWAMLFFDPLGQKLVIEQVKDQHGEMTAGSQPILTLDVWEHAYYLQYLNVRADYVAAWWNTVNWQDVAARLSAARGVSLG
jgi:Fe-Mn family superoxide dismutase